MSNTKKMRELIAILNKASSDYYNSNPSMTDKEWDKLYDELVTLENETNIIYSDSPTQNVGYKIVGEIEEVEHNHPMLSLDKCHTEQELIEFASDKDCVLSVKCDGLTTSLHYVDGELVGAETRGNGVFGGNVLHNVMTIKNVPHTIPYKGELIIDGETIIDWNTFNLINDNLPEGQKKYKHPRNLVSGTLNVLDSKVAASRNMRFIGWRVIKGLNKKSVFFALKDAEKLGFEIVPMWTYTNKSTDKENISLMLSDLREKSKELGIPYDGAVMAYDDIEYGMSLGRTDKFFRHSVAYKYEDSLYETTLRDIEWTMGKTGILTPTAIFNTVEIDGTSVERASLHNISVMKELGVCARYQEINVYKANQIIPQIASAEKLPFEIGTYDELIFNNGIGKAYEGKFQLFIPGKCPICGGKTSIIKENSSEVLVCDNSECKGKLLGKLSHFVSKNAVNIDGLSEQTLEKLIELGWLKSFQDIYRLSEHKDEMSKLDGFGKRSVEKLLDAIEKSRSITLDRFIYALCIPLIGRSASKDISKACANGDVQQFITIMSLEGEYAFIGLNGFGKEMCKSIVHWWVNNKQMFYELIKEFTFEKVEEKSSGVDLSSKVFVITGSLNHYKNRDELVGAIEGLGGKVSGSVSAKTSYLINNDKLSSSSKNQKAQKLNIPIISEEDFIKMIGE